MSYPRTLWNKQHSSLKVLVLVGLVSVQLYLAAGSEDLLVRAGNSIFACDYAGKTFIWLFLLHHGVTVARS